MWERLLAPLVARRGGCDPPPDTLNVRGKARRKRTLQAGKASDWKKAIVTLKEGDKIVLT